MKGNIVQSRHVAMTYQEFELMPRSIGWKHEYWDGQAHITPDHQTARATIRTSSRSFTAPCKLRHVDACDTKQLVSAYLSAFSDTIEYCDWKPESISESACNAIDEYFSGKRGQAHPSSRLAVVPTADGEERIGAALLSEKNGVLTLDMLFVKPEWQRKGVATALVSAAINELYQAGTFELASRYVIGNCMSRAWHRKFGFIEVVDPFLARYYHHHATQE